MKKKRNILRRESIDKKYRNPLKEELKIIYGWEHYNNSRDANQNEVMRTIRHYHKTEQLVTMLEELYPDGITDGELNDILYYEWEWLYGKLGIPLNATEDDEINIKKNRVVKESIYDTEPHLIVSGDLSLYSYDDYELVSSYDKKEYIFKRADDRPIKAMIEDFSVEYDDGVESKNYDNLNFMDVELSYITVDANAHFELEDITDCTIPFRVELSEQDIIDYGKPYFDLDSTCFDETQNFIHEITVDLSNNDDVLDEIMDLY